MKLRRVKTDEELVKMDEAVVAVIITNQPDVESAAALITDYFHHVRKARP